MSKKQENTKDSSEAAELDVSVVIPTYNEGNWLERTIDSILAAKTDLAYEIIIFDDASTDGSVASIRNRPRVRITSAGTAPAGCIVGRNRGAAAATGKYICFLDSHVLVGDYWLDHLRETSRRFADRALVSGNILNVLKQGDPSVEQEQYALTLEKWATASAWHFHGYAVKREPYLAPLCPTGLMFVCHSYFWGLGGFSECIKKWGSEDVEISLKNYMSGGFNVVDPRVIVYHNYKNLTDNQRTFSISHHEIFFNVLFVARTFGSDEVYAKAKVHLAQQADISPLISELESGRYDSEIEVIQSRFVRTWEDFTHSFQRELGGFAIPAE